MARDDIIATQPRSPETMLETAIATRSGLALVSSDRMAAEKSGAEVIRIALIDSIQLSQDCLIRAFNAIHPELLITPFDSVEACLRTDQTDLDVVLYCTHDDALSEHRTMQCIVELRQKFALTPVVVLSDSRAPLPPQSIRSALESGARGFIPTLNTRVPAVLTALRFIKDGGTFVPLDLLLSCKGEKATDKVGSVSPNVLTPRQKAVLAQLKQGKANKIIAYELSMSESTVKIHIRNIMRKMGATNRTEAVYKSESLHASY